MATTTTTVPQSGTAAGSCSGAQLLAKLKTGAGTGWTDQTQRVSMSTSLMTDRATKAKVAGTCTGLVEPVDNAGGAIPATLHPKAISLNLTGLAACAASPAALGADASKANAFPLTGKLTITMNELDSLGKRFQVQAYVAVRGADPAASDVLQVTGVVAKGASTGATVSGKLYMDAVSAISPKPATGNGYEYDAATANACADGTPNNATEALAQIGDGTSLTGGDTATGIRFDYAPPGAAGAAQCAGSELLAKVQNLTDQTARTSLSTALLTDLASKTKIAGTCAGLVVPADNPGGAIPAMLHPKAVALKLSGLASCASAPAAIGADASKANAFPLTGKLTITMNELDGLGNKFQVQAYVTVSGRDPGTPDVLEFTGIVSKGASVGATVSGKLYLDPVTAVSPKPHTGNGYEYDTATANACADGTAGNATFTLGQMGDGSSPAGSTAATGFSFGYVPAS